jgi:hypothetical protein
MMRTATSPPTAAASISTTSRTGWCRSAPRPPQPARPQPPVTAAPCRRTSAAWSGQRTTCPARGRRSLTECGSRMDARDDARSAEQDEAPQDNGDAIAPVDPPGQHHEPDCCHGNHCHHGCDRAEQGPLEPVDGRDEDAGSGRISVGILRKCRCCSYKTNYRRDCDADAIRHGKFVPQPTIRRSDTAPPMEDCNRNSSRIRSFFVDFSGASLRGPYLRAAIFLSQVVVAIDQSGCRSSRFGPRRPSRGIVGQDREARAVGRARPRAGQPVLGVVAEAGCPVAREVAFLISALSPEPSHPNLHTSIIISDPLGSKLPRLRRLHTEQKRCSNQESL